MQRMVDISVGVKPGLQSIHCIIMHPISNCRQASEESRLLSSCDLQCLALTKRLLHLHDICSHSHFSFQTLTQLCNAWLAGRFECKWIPGSRRQVLECWAFIINTRPGSGLHSYISNDQTGVEFWKLIFQSLSFFRCMPNLLYLLYFIPPEAIREPTGGNMGAYRWQYGSPQVAI